MLDLLKSSSTPVYKPAPSSGQLDDTISIYTLSILSDTTSDSDETSICSRDGGESYHTAADSSFINNIDVACQMQDTQVVKSAFTSGKDLRPYENPYEKVFTRLTIMTGGGCGFRTRWKLAFKIYRPATGGPYTWDPIYGWLTEEQKATPPTFAMRPHVWDSKFTTRRTWSGIKVPEWKEERIYAPATGGPYTWHTQHGWLDRYGRKPHIECRTEGYSYVIHSEDEVARMKQYGHCMQETSPLCVYDCSAAEAVQFGDHYIVRDTHINCPPAHFQPCRWHVRYGWMPESKNLVRFLDMFWAKNMRREDRERKAEEKRKRLEARRRFEEAMFKGQQERERLRPQHTVFEEEDNWTRLKDLLARCEEYWAEHGHLGGFTLHPEEDLM